MLVGRAQQEWDPESIAGKLVAALRPYLGLHTAQSAVKTFCRPLEVEPAKLTEVTLEARRLCVVPGVCGTGHNCRAIDHRPVKG